jgi:hypothetical protein
MAKKIKKFLGFGPSKPKKKKKKKKTQTNSVA